MRGQHPGPAVRTCFHPECESVFAPAQKHQRYCTPAHRFDAARLRRALPLAVAYLEGVMAEMNAVDRAEVASR